MEKKKTVLGLSLIIAGEHSKEEIEKMLIPKLRWILVRGRNRYYSDIRIETLEIEESEK